MNPFVLAKVCNSRMEADLLKAYLEMEGIEVMIKADDAGGMLPMLASLNGVSVLVPENDLKRALEIFNNKG
jgi:hypothetical protein